MARTRSQEVLLSGFGGHPMVSAEQVSPERVSEARDVVRTHGGVLVPRGGGNSYGDVAIARHGVTVDMRRLDRVLEWDEGLQTIHVEAGATVDALLGWLLPRGRTLAVVPGAPNATVGGCVAMDVHGKNAHSKGSFADHVAALQLMDGEGLIEASPKREADLFRRTIGGLGGTGIVYSAVLQTTPAASGLVRVSHQATGSLRETLAVLLERCGSNEFVYAWVDPMATGRHRGRAIVWSADRMEERVPGPATAGADGRTTAGGPVLPVPRSSAWVGLGAAKAITGFAWRAGARGSSGEAVQDERSFHFPFARLPGWANVYGRTGFYERQFVFPDEAAHDVIEQILLLREKFSQPAIFSSLKRFTTRSPGYLGFVRPGVSFAIQLPRCDSTGALVREMNDVVRAVGGVEYLAKTQDEPSLLLENVLSGSGVSAASLPGAYAEVNSFLARNSKGGGLRV